MVCARLGMSSAEFEGVCACVHLLIRQLWANLADEFA
jgi:hypothetical protein